MKPRILLVLSLLCLSLITGCATHKKAYQVRWDSCVGKYTYSEMLDDFGPPLVSTNSPDGSITGKWGRFVDDNWHVHHTSLVYRPDDYFDGYYLLTFDPKGVLVKWSFTNQ